MKTLIFILFFSLISCGSDDKKTNLEKAYDRGQNIEVKTVSIENWGMRYDNRKYYTIKIEWTFNSVFAEKKYCDFRIIIREGDNAPKDCDDLQENDAEYTASFYELVYIKDFKFDQKYSYRACSLFDGKYSKGITGSFNEKPREDSDLFY